jgi:hypothetical protein
VSWSIHLFVDGSPSLHDLAKQLIELLSLPLQEFEEEEEHYFQYDDGCYLCVTLRKNSGLENDRDMNFEDFAYELQIRARRISDWEAAQKACLELGQIIFEKLKKLQRYRLMLTRQLGTKLASFSPEPIAR